MLSNKKHKLFVKNMETVNSLVEKFYKIYDESNTHRIYGFWIKEDSLFMSYHVSTKTEHIDLTEKLLNMQKHEIQSFFDNLIVVVPNTTVGKIKHQKIF